MKVGIIIIHYKSLENTAECLKSIENLKKNKTELTVYIIDNNSEIGTSTLKSNKVLVKIIKSDKNLGYSGGNNLGGNVAYLDGMDYLWFLNDDIILDKNCLDNLVNFIGNHPKAGVVGPKVYFATGYEYHKDRYSKSDLGNVIWWAGGKIDWNNVWTNHTGIDEVDKGQFNKTGLTDTVVGVAMLVTRDVWKVLGGFDDRYYLYYEEGDFCQRAVHAGYELYYVADSLVWHKNSGSSGPGSKLHDYFLTRNRLLFGYMYAPYRTKFALFRESVRMLFVGRTWQKRGILDFYLGKFGRGSFPEEI